MTTIGMMDNPVVQALESAVSDCATELELFESLLCDRYPAEVIAIAFGTRTGGLLGLLVDAKEYTPKQVRDFLAIVEHESLGKPVSYRSNRQR